MTEAINSPTLFHSQKYKWQYTEPQTSYTLLYSTENKHWRLVKKLIVYRY